MPERTCENCKYHIHCAGIIYVCARAKELDFCNGEGTCDKWERRHPIKRCPFCGGGAEVVLDMYSCYVQCVSCHAKGTEVWFGEHKISEGSILDAIERWNKRWK